MARTLLGRLVARAAPAIPDAALPAVLTVRSLGSDLVLGLPTVERALVVVAHPDDDVIGCGGTLALLSDAGVTVTIVYAANGDSTAGSPDRPAEVATARRREAEQASALLGVTDCRFLGWSDHTVGEHRSELAAELHAIIAETQPDLVLCPWVVDDHDDHRQVARAAADAADPEQQIWMFEVWTPLVPNRLVDITSVIDRKRSALALHATADLAFELEATVGLNRFRSIHRQRGQGYAEAFLAATAGRLRELLPDLDRLTTSE